jgi:hypothetical protein
MRRYHELGEIALQNEGKETFKAVNRQGHEAFGYYFSLSNALFVASLWPVPIMENSRERLGKTTVTMSVFGTSQCQGTAKG